MFYKYYKPPYYLFLQKYLYVLKNFIMYTNIILQIILRVSKKPFQKQQPKHYQSLNKIHKSNIGKQV